MGSRVIQVTGGWKEKKCQWCGNYFVDGDTLVLIVPTYEFKSKYKRLRYNVVIHAHEFDELMCQCESDETKVWELIGNHPVPRLKHDTYSVQELQEIEAFKMACRDYGFRRCTEVKNEVHMRRGGTSSMMIYKIKSKTLENTWRGKSNLFNGLIQRQNEATISNRMSELLGLAKYDDFTVVGVLQEVKKVSLLC